MRVYLAGPLFTLAERRFMAHLRDLAGELPGVEAVWDGRFANNGWLQEFSSAEYYSPDFTREHPFAD